MRSPLSSELDRPTYNDLVRSELFYAMADSYDLEMNNDEPVDEEEL